MGRGTAADLRLTDEGVSRAHAEIATRGGEVSVRDLGSRNGTFHNGRRTAFGKLSDGDKLAIGAMTVLKLSFQDDLDEAFQRDLYASAVRDALTHALRQELFFERLQAEVTLAMRHSLPLALICWEIDDFQQLNDLYGRPAGDRVLATLARAAGAAIRHEDVLGRWGGDELALLCRGTTAELAHHTAERLRRLVASTPVPLDHATVDVTASFGVAICPAPGIASAPDLVRAAAAALHRAKTAGKNRTEGPD